TGPKPAAGSLAVPDTPPGIGAPGAPEEPEGPEIPKALPVTVFTSAPAGRATRRMLAAIERSATAPKQGRSHGTAERGMRMRSPRTSQRRCRTTGKVSGSSRPGRAELAGQKLFPRLGVFRSLHPDHSAPV